jgi:hypothetical protein
MILLLAFSSPNGEASELIIHLWYSCALTTPMAAALKEKLAPLIKKAYNKLKDPLPESMIVWPFMFGNSCLFLTLKFMMWKRLLDLVEGKCFTDFEKADKSRKIVNSNLASQHWIDETERLNFNAPRSRRVVDDLFRERGIMLPSGAAIDNFKIPNPYVPHLAACI